MQQIAIANKASPYFMTIARRLLHTNVGAGIQEGDNTIHMPALRGGV
jgi:hypothetical protein